MIDLTQAARANRRLRNGGREMIAWAGRCLRLAVRTVIRAVKMAHHEQMSMWECILLTSGAAPLTAAGPLRWGSVGGRLPGSPATTCRPRTQAKQGGNPGWRPPARSGLGTASGILHEPPGPPDGTSGGAKSSVMCSPRRRSANVRSSP